MERRPALIKQADLTRLAKATQAAGVAEWRVELELATGKVAIIAGKKSGDDPTSDWD